MRAGARLDVDPGAGAGAAHLRWRSVPPVVLRPTGADRVHLVHAAGGPLGGDDLALTLRLGAAGPLRVRSAGATVVQSGPAPARWSVTADIADGALLDWAPEPTVVCDGAELRSDIRLTVHRGGAAIVREEVVLGRAGQRGGRYRGGLCVAVDGEPVLAHTLLLDGADPALSGPAGGGGARSMGALLVVGEHLAGPPQDAGERPGLRWACSALDGPGRLLTVLGDSAAAVSALLDRAVAQINS